MRRLPPALPPPRASGITSTPVDGLLVIKSREELRGQPFAQRALDHLHGVIIFTGHQRKGLAACAHARPVRPMRWI